MEEEFCVWGGWAQGSDMARVYVPLGKTHLQNAFERIYGKGEAAKREESLLKPVTCTICGHENQAGAEACHRCAQPLTVEAALKLRDTREKDQNAMLAVNELHKMVDERVQKLLEERLKQVNL